MSRNSSLPSTFARSQIVDPGVVSPRIPTRTPWRSTTVNGGNAVESVPATKTLAPRNGNSAPAIARSSAGMPKLNSWFPTAAAS